MRTKRTALLYPFAVRNLEGRGRHGRHRSDPGQERVAQWLGPKVLIRASSLHAVSRRSLPLVLTLEGGTMQRAALHTQPTCPCTFLK
jgi:hypothetical protein